MIAALFLGVPSGIRGEGSGPFEYGIEQEIRSRLQLVTVAPLFIPLFSSKAVLGDAITRGEDSRYLSALRRESRKPGRNVVVDDHRVYYPHLDWGFKVGIDFTVLEIALEPFTLKKLKAARADLQRDLFDLPARIGIRPMPSLGAGHMHIGLKNFNNDPLFFMNYIIDYVNHSELSNGVFLYEPVNAAPLVQDARSREGFQRLIRDFDEGRVKTIDEIRERLHELGFSKVAGRIQGAINVKTKYPTIELRAMRSYTSVQEMIDFVELQEMRLRHLATKKERIPFLDVGAIRSRRQGVAQFHHYVTEAGGDWNRFKRLLPPGWRRLKPDFANAFRRNPGGMGFFLGCHLAFGELLGI